MRISIAITRTRRASSSRAPPPAAPAQARSRRAVAARRPVRLKAADIVFEGTIPGRQSKRRWRCERSDRLVDRGRRSQRGDRRRQCDTVAPLQRPRAIQGLTMGKPLIMGRKTFQAIGATLPGRETMSSRATGLGSIRAWPSRTTSQRRSAFRAEPRRSWSPEAARFMLR